MCSLTSALAHGTHTMALLIGTVESGADGGLMEVDFSEGIGVGAGFQERLAKIGGALGASGALNT